MADESLPTSLALVPFGRASLRLPANGHDLRQDDRRQAESRWREDLRLFVTTYAAGFVFFLTFLA